MSRHKVKGINERHQIAIGYDRQLSQFFLQVRGDLDEIDLSIDRDASTIEELLALSKPYASISHELVEKLRRERYNNEYLPGSSSKIAKPLQSNSVYDYNADITRSFSVVETPSCTAIFDNMRVHFLNCIRAHDAALCAVYSLSDQQVIDALASLSWVSVILDEEQKSVHCNYENLLNHEGISSDELSSVEIYHDGVDSGYSRYDELSALTFAVRDPAPGKKARFESFHSKFCVFLDVEIRTDDIGLREKILVPRAVWVGSFNPTPTGDRSIQSAVILRDRQIVLAFMAEFFALHRSTKKSLRRRHLRDWQRKASGR